MIEPVFGACDFDREDCLAAELLILNIECRIGLGLANLQSDVLMLQKQEHIDMVSFAPLDGWIVSTCANMLLFHKDLVEKLESQDCIKGLCVIPASIEIPEKGTLDDWMWVSSIKDLGKPLTHRRFVRSFSSVSSGKGFPPSPPSMTRNTRPLAAGTAWHPHWHTIVLEGGFFYSV
ncbi:MAG: hypothetical protein JXB88_00705 [Spirochaetales bacterium]|nr:hypothetical protein [Spirochaetales bacterium]